jgi:flagellar biosynthesis/type III secretory pathway M-ring protein FliF/YscJ
MSGLVIAAAPALPLHSAGKYVAGAYIVFLAVVLIYVTIMARRLTRTERELRELRRQAARTDTADDESAREREHVA